MADQGLIAPLMSDDPASSYQAYFDAQRKQMLAQMLMQHAANAGQTPADWNQMRAVPRANPLTTIGGGIAAALMAKKALRGAQKAQQDYMTGLMGNTGQPAPAQPAPQQSMQPAAPQTQDADSNGPTVAPIPTPSAPQQASSSLAAPQQAQQANPAFDAWKSAFDSSKEGRVMRIAQPFEYGKLVAEQRAKFAMPSGGERPGMPRYENGRIVGYAPDVGQGIYYDRGPNGEPIARKIPYQADIVAQQAAATEGAKYNSVPHEFPTQGGGTTFGYWGGAPGQIRPNTPLTNGAGLSAPGANAGPPDKWSDMPKLNIPTGLGKPDAYTENRLRHAADKDAELATKYGEQSDMADQRIAFNNMALNILKSAETGPLADRITKIKAAAQEAGIPESMIPNWAKVSATQELKKDLVRNALVSLKPTFGARPAASEFQVLKEEANPSDQMTSLAIKRLLTVDNESAQYQKQRANDYGEYSQRGGNPMRFESYYSRKYPVAPSLEAARAKVDQKPQVSKADAEAELRRRGLLK